MLSDCKSDSTLPLWLLSNDMYQQDNVLSDMYVLFSAAKNLRELNIIIFSLAAFIKKNCVPMLLLTLTHSLTFIYLSDLHYSLSDG